MKTIGKLFLAALGGVAAFVILGIVAVALAGCSPEQIAKAQSGVDTAKVAYVAATQVVSDGQRAIDAIDVELRAATVEAAALPVDSPQRKASESVLAALNKARGVASAGLSAAQKHEGEAKATLDMAQNVLTAIKTGTVPDTSPLGAFGPYGELAGLILGGGLTLYQAAKNGKLNAQVKAANADVATHKAVLEALTGEPHPVDALVAGLKGEEVPKPA